MSGGTYYIHDTMEMKTNSFYCKEHDMEVDNSDFMKHMIQYHQKSYYEDKE